MTRNFLLIAVIPVYY